MDFVPVKGMSKIMFRKVATLTEEEKEYRKKYEAYLRHRRQARMTEEQKEEHLKKFAKSSSAFYYRHRQSVLKKIRDNYKLQKEDVPVVDGIRPYVKRNAPKTKLGRPRKIIST